MTEYGMMTTTFKLKEELEGITSDEISQSLSLGTHEYLKSLPASLDSFEGGGWRVVSHALTKIDSHLVLTFLIYRDKLSTSFRSN
jgi:hypothetical protein